MCGIVGYSGSRPAASILLNGLAKLEYRGYDSAGLALQGPANALWVVKRAGKIGRLAEALRKSPAPAGATVGIGHTRWATHGAPTDPNAHPHLDCKGRIAVVHNGIIENHRALKTRLQKRGHRFRSQTDSEVLAHLIEEESSRRPWMEAVRRALGRIQGTYSVVAMRQGEPDALIGARSGGGALVVGLGNGENFIASDVPALLAHTRRVQYLEDEEMALVGRDSVRILDIRSGKDVPKKTVEIEWTPDQAEKGGYPHFMIKEIMEQPRALQDTFSGRLDPGTGEVLLEGPFWSDPFLKKFRRVILLAMGTSYYAAMVGKDLLEKFLRIPVSVENASEFRYRTPVVDEHTLCVVISQSGETVDTLVALREAKGQKARIAAICNVMGSSVTREADGVLLTRAGPEIGVASTKAFTTQLGALWLLALRLARVRGSMKTQVLRKKARELSRIPSLLGATLRSRASIERIARRYASSFNFLFIGRGAQYPIALEGALKLKEISYIHAEGYPGGELKHGPIALIDKKMPVVALALKSSGTYEKILSNIEEVHARKGRLIVVAEKGDLEVRAKADEILEVPRVDEDLAPILTVVPLQLLAYEIAKRKRREIDQPRNLAKSVTVE